MAVTKYQYIFGSFVLSLISVGFLVSAYATRNWVEGELTAYEIDKTNSIKYGLFDGTFLFREYSTPSEFPIYSTCLYGDNICVFSCKQSIEVRQEEIREVLRGNNVSLACDNKISASDAFDMKLVWSNGGVYVCTLIFLSSAVLTAAISTVFSAINIKRTPVEPLIGIFGLKIWNGCAAFSDLMVLLFYGIHFATNVKDNLSFIYSVLQFFTVIESRLGFSYWFVLASLLCHSIAFGLLFLRSWLISKEPPPPMISIEKSDDTIFLY